MPKISVIVPVYKVEKYINRCVDSILAQTFQDFELILVDDGSPDNCGAICDEYAARDGRIVVIHQENCGLSAARNAGIDWAFKNSNSEWISFVDSDDWLHIEYLNALYSAVGGNRKCVSLCRFLRVDEKEKAIEGDYTCKGITFEELYSETHEGFSGVIAWAKLYPKEFWRDIRFPIGKLHEDLYITHQVLYQCERIVLVNASLYFYYQRNDSIMNSEWTVRRLDELEASEMYATFFRDKKMLNAYENALIGVFWVIEKQIRAIESSNCHNKEYIKSKLRNKLRILIMQNKRVFLRKFSYRKYLLEIAFPRIMRCYWLIVSVKNKLFQK